MNNEEAKDRLILLKMSYKIRIEEEDIEALDMGAEALKTQKIGHWIPVSERLPKEDESVLLTICANSSLYGFNKNFIKVMCGSYSPCEDKRDWIVNGIRYYIDNVIAWMPLPEPYKAELKGENK